MPQSGTRGTNGLLAVYMQSSCTCHVISQHGDRCLGGLITPAYSLMLRLSTPVYQGRDVICLV